MYWGKVTSQVTHHPEAYPGFYSPLDGMLVHRKVTPSIKFTIPIIHLGEERHCENKVSYPRTHYNVPSK